MRGCSQGPAAEICLALSLLVVAPAALPGCGSGGQPAKASNETPAPGSPSSALEQRDGSQDGPGESPAPPWEACYATFAPEGEARTDLSRLVRNCGGVGGMRPITTVRTGEQSELDPVDAYTFEVPRAGTCYRVYAAADATVEDLDLLLRGPDGSAKLADLTHDAWPVLPPREPACFAAAGMYRLEVSVYRGSGRYALQVWGR
jgi:hypothetical protein